MITNCMSLHNYPSSGYTSCRRCLPSVYSPRHFLRSYCIFALLPPSHVTSVISFICNAVGIEILRIQQLALLLPNLTTVDVLYHSSHLPETGHYSLPPSLKSFRISVDTINCCPPLFNALSSLKHLQCLLLQINAPMAGAHGDDLDASNCSGNPFSKIEFAPLMPLVATLQQVVIKFQVLERSMTSEAEAMSPMPTSLIEFVRQLSASEVAINLPETSSNRAFMARFWKSVTAPDEGANHQVPPIMQSGNLTSLELGETTLDRAILESFIKFPSLTALKPTNVDLHADDIALLSKLPNIKALNMSKMGSVSCTTKDCVSICTSFPKLEQLRLTYWNLTSQQLDKILAKLPSLTLLGLNGCNRISSLAPLSKHGLPHRLKQLYLADVRVSVSDLSKYILPLENLELLDLGNVCNDAVPLSIQAQLRAMPKVIKCTLDLDEPDDGGFF